MQMGAHIIVCREVEHHIKILNDCTILQLSKTINTDFQDKD